MPATSESALLGAEGSSGEALTVVRNVSTRYVAIGVEMLVGVLVLPFNISHLGKEAYGLWMLTASITAYFSLLDLGYSGAMVKFVAQYRAKRDARALNEVLSTMFYLFAGFGAVTYVVAIVLATHLGQVFHLAPGQVSTGRIVLLVTSLNVAVGTAFSVFGGVINGFQRYDLNNIVGTATSVVIGVVNILVLLAGYGLVELVCATTVMRVLAYWIYRANAYRVFPGLSLRPQLFSLKRLHELTMFSVYMLLIDWANKLNYSVDALVIGAFLNTGAVAVWMVAQRLAETTQRLTNQLNEVLFPTVVDHDMSSRLDRLQTIFLIGTRLSLASVIGIAGALMLMARPLVVSWVGPDFADSAIVVQLLALTVIVRVGNATATTILKGAGRHRLVAVSNVITAVVNLSLSIAAVRPFGLPGVALGTLLPVSVTAAVVLFPAGCRRVQLPLGIALARAVWPATWPAAVMAGYVLLTRPMVGTWLPAIGAEMIAAVAVYGATFIGFCVSVRERQICVNKALELVGRPPAPIRTIAEGT